MTPLAMGLAGIVADLTGQNIPPIFLTCGFISAFVGVLLSLSRDFRKFLAFETENGSDAGQDSRV
ncbi:hypothetical protein ACFLU6_00830 [Acidobacteriota bacterium]